MSNCWSQLLCPAPVSQQRLSQPSQLARQQSSMLPCLVCPRGRPLLRLLKSWSLSSWRRRWQVKMMEGCAEYTQDAVILSRIETYLHGSERLVCQKQGCVVSQSVCLQNAKSCVSKLWCAMCILDGPCSRSEIIQSHVDNVTKGQLCAF